MKPIGSVKSIHGKAYPKLPRQRRLRGRHIFVGLMALLAAVLLQNSFVGHNDPPPPVPKPALDYPDFFAMRSEYLSRFSTKHHVIEQGDTLNQVFQRFGLPSECVTQWQKSCRDFCQMSQLQPGDELDIQVSNQDQQPVRFVFSSVGGSTYTFHKLKNSWECNEDVRHPTKIVDAAGGAITDNLYDSCIRAGMTPGLIMELADLFAYDIDFNTDLHEGDTFAVYFEQQVKDGKTVHAGPVLAAQMVVGGEPYNAFFYQMSDGYKGYFDSEGRSLKKLFLRAPLSYSRISSTFSYKRFHPISKTFRPHLGIDYAAPAGAPVSSLGEGTVTFMGRKGGFGKFIEVQHGNSYKTTYGHLADYAKGLRAGSKVAQGDVIGYVGSSGISTGPHLDFRFYRNGKPLDFLKTEFPRARSISKTLLSDFQKKREIYLAALREKLPASQSKSAKTATNE